jgi:hypothetical protein
MLANRLPSFVVELNAFADRLGALENLLPTSTGKRDTPPRQQLQSIQPISRSP